MLVKCRKVGAIGIFYWVDFPDVNTKDEWYNKYSENWELWCFELMKGQSNGKKEKDQFTENHARCRTG